MFTFYNEIFIKGHPHNEVAFSFSESFTGRDSRIYHTGKCRKNK